MKTTLFSLLFCIPALIAAPSAQGLTAAQAFPSRPITLVIPAPPGGSNDIFGRLLGQELTTELGQPVIIENKPGANYGIAASHLARSTPDGYTLLLTGAPTFTVNPILYKNTGYDPDKDFAYVAVTGGTPFVLLTIPLTGLKSVSDLIHRARSDSTGIPYATFGTGSTPHLGGARMADAAGIKMDPVPYKGSAPGIADLMGGHIPLSIDTTVAALPHVRSGQLIALAQTGDRRSALLPDVPTLVEAGVPGVHFDTWFGVVAPSATPEPIVQKITTTLSTIMNKPEVQQRLLELGLDARFKDANQFRKLVDVERQINRKVIDNAGIQVN